MLASSLDRDANYSDWGFLAPSQFPETNSGITNQLGHDRFLPNSFQFITHLSSYRSTLYSLANDGIVKYSRPHEETCWQFHLTTELIMNNSKFWYITPCGPLKVNRRFGGTCYIFHAGFLLGSFFDPEDGSDMFLWNVGWILTDYTALYLRR
jgi:hypothetical protein